MPYFRQSLNSSSLPTRPLPSWKGWISSKCTWKLKSVWKSCLLSDVYFSISFCISLATFSGGQVSVLPMVLLRLLYSPTLNQSISASVVFDFRIRCISLMKFSSIFWS